MLSLSPAKPRIMVAPNGARRGTAEHPALPITLDKIVAEAKACYAAGADALHLHIRDKDGRHSLDPGQYREALAALRHEVPALGVQITTESAGVFDIPDQIAAIAGAMPSAASISVREMAHDPTLASRMYALCRDIGTNVQHILYDTRDWDLLQHWRKTGLINAAQTDVICVLGRYDPPCSAKTSDLAALPFDPKTRSQPWMVCAFGASEQAVLLRAAELGADLRIGFENNIHAPDGGLAASNADNLKALRAALSAAYSEKSLVS